MLASKGSSRLEPWPELIHYNAFRDTRDTLHRYLQVAGKIRSALTPEVNHLWNAALKVTARGLTTGPIPFAGGAFEIDFDFLAQEVRILSSWGDERVLALDARPVAEFYVDVMATLRSIGVQAAIWDVPVEVLDRTPFSSDYHHAAYDAPLVETWFRALVSAHSVMEEFRGRFTGKCSPVHFFWGSMDLACTRYSGRPAPQTFQDPVMQEAYAEECMSVGFWPGDERYPHPSFYAYAAPEPEGFNGLQDLAEGAFYSAEMREYLYPYDEVHRSEKPREELLSFFQETYEAAANFGKWDRNSLERPLIHPRLHAVEPVVEEPPPLSGAW